MTRDVDLLVDEPELALEPDDLLACTVAERAALTVIDDDLLQGYRPRVIVASATRWTARP